MLGLQNIGVFLSFSKGLGCQAICQFWYSITLYGSQSTSSLSFGWEWGFTDDISSPMKILHLSFIKIQLISFSRCLSCRQEDDHELMWGCGGLWSCQFYNFEYSGALSTFLGCFLASNIHSASFKYIYQSSPIIGFFCLRINGTQTL